MAAVQQGSSLTHVHVHSHDRDSGVSEDFYFDLQHHSSLRHRLARVGLRSAVIPNQAYNVPLGKNYLDITEVGSGAWLRFTVPVGYYSLSNLVTALDTAVPTVLFGVPSSTNWDFKYDPLTDRVSLDIYSVGPVHYALQINSDPSSLHMQKLLGFDYRTTAYPVSPITAARAPMLLPHKYIYVCMEGVRSGICLGSSGPLDTVVFPLPVNVPYGEIIVYENVNPIFVNYGNGQGESLPKFHLTLRDSSGAIYDNNGAEWSCTLEMIFAPDGPLLQ